MTIPGFFIDAMVYVINYEIFAKNANKKIFQLFYYIVIVKTKKLITEKKKNANKKNGTF